MILGAADSVGLDIADADHCDFEDPTDWLCTTFCPGGGTGFSDEEILETVRGLLVSGAVWAAGIDAGAKGHWWVPGGTYYEELRGRGAISPL